MTNKTRSPAAIAAILAVAGALSACAGMTHAPGLLCRASAPG